MVSQRCSREGRPPRVRLQGQGANSRMVLGLGCPALPEAWRVVLREVPSHLSWRSSIPLPQTHRPSAQVLGGDSSTLRDPTVLVDRCFPTSNGQVQLEPGPVCRGLSVLCRTPSELFVSPGPLSVQKHCWGVGWSTTLSW